MTPLEEAVKEFVRALRTEIGAENISELYFEVEASGRTLDGDILIKYTLGDIYTKYRTEGGNLGAVVEEFIRRNGWQNRNCPKCLPSPTLLTGKVEDEIPF